MATEPKGPKDSDRERKIHRALGIVFFAIGLFVSIDLIHLTSQVSESHNHLEKQVSCNNQLIDVLRKRSDARLYVDQTTHDFQMTMTALLEDIEEHGAALPIDDLHVIEARQAGEKAAAARTNPELWLLYPDCTG